MTMGEREKLLTLLFERGDGKELVNIKFFQGQQSVHAGEDMCAAARRVVEQIWAGDAQLSTVAPDEELVT